MHSEAGTVLTVLLPRHGRRSLIRTGRGAPRATCEPTGGRLDTWPSRTEELS